MDFMKTLMIYMSAVVAAGIGAAPTPGVSPTPAPVATAVVELIPSETAGTNVVGSITVTAPPATQTPAPAGPTVTPNKAYRTLRMKDRGDSVRRLQQRLRDLGYLSGNVDGVYGYQTRNAVLAFQKANGLARDGVAGPITQTILFEDESVIPNLSVMTPSPVPTATPDSYGLVPMPEDPVSLWAPQRGAVILLNGTALEGPPSLWMRGGEMILSLDELTSAAGWDFTVSDGDSMTLDAEGYEIAARISQGGLTRRVGTDGFCDSFTATESGMPVDLAQGDLVAGKGAWYASAAFLEKAMKAEIVWDGDENTLVIRVDEKRVAEAND